MTESSQEFAESTEMPPERSREEIAMDKVIDVIKAREKDSGIFIHGTSVKKLGSILRNGIVAENFANRAGVDGFERRYSSVRNEKYVSISKLDEGFVEDIGFIVKPLGEVTKPDQVVIRRGDFYPTLGEFVVPHRIAPREFLGIYIQGSGKWAIRRGKYAINPRVIVKEIKGLSTESAIPIYDFQGNLIWPKRMTREEIARMLEKKEHLSDKPLKEAA